VRLSKPVALEPFDRFVLRDSGRRATVAGGLVIDVEPPARQGHDPAARLALRLRGGRAKLPGRLVAERGAASDAEIAVLTGAEAAEIPGAVRVDEWWTSPDLHRLAAASTDAFLTDFHDRHPVSEGADAAQVRAAVADALARARLPAAAHLVDALISSMEGSGAVVRRGSKLRLASHAAKTGGGEIDGLVRTVAEGEPAPPTVPDLVRRGFSRELIEAASSGGRLVKVSVDLVMTKELVERAEKLLRERGEGTTVSAFRENLGASRKYAVPLLEYFDRKGITRREGDLRFPRSNGQET
jgi:selenocysteine-specific elongation factor